MCYVMTKEEFDENAEDPNFCGCCMVVVEDNEMSEDHMCIYCEEEMKNLHNKPKPPVW